MIERRFDLTEVEPTGVSAVLVLKTLLLPTMLHSSEAYCHPRVMTLMINFGVETLLVIDLVEIRLKNRSQHLVRMNFAYQCIMVADFSKNHSWAFFPNIVLQEWVRSNCAVADPRLNSMSLSSSLLTAVLHLHRRFVIIII